MPELPRQAPAAAAEVAAAAASECAAAADETEDPERPARLPG